MADDTLQLLHSRAYIGDAKLSVLGCKGVATHVWSRFLLEQTYEHITAVDLSNNDLSDHAVNSLCGAIKKAPSVRLLSLGGNKAKDVARLTEIALLGHLQALDLTSNNLNNKSAAQLAHCLPETALQHLWLSSNARLTSEGLALLVRKLPCSALQTLWLDGTALDDGGLSELIEVLGRAALEELNVANTRVTDSLACELLRTAPKTQLCRLVVDDAGERVNWQRCKPLLHGCHTSCGVSDLARLLGDTQLKMNPSTQQPFFKGQLASVQVPIG
eukprot:6468930-Amphidinium_carterae.1